MTHCAGGSGRAPGWMWAAVGLLLVFYILVALWLSGALAHDAQNHAQMTPEQRDWFGRQIIPKGAPNAGGSCCSQADGQFAEEDIRGDHYWARWPASEGVWHQVPSEVVILAPNRNGAAAIWWGGSAYDGTLYIRCFAPGGGL